MMSQDNLDFQNRPILWLTKANEPKNYTIEDITDENNFIIVNPEEIGTKILENLELNISFLRSRNLLNC